MTLPRARVVAVMVGGVEYLARRGKPGQPFDAFGPDYSTIMEPVARWLVIPEAEMAQREHRVLEEFPAPSLAELVGDAPAFWFTNTDNIPFIACRAGDWRGPGDDGLWYALPRHRGDRPYMFEGPLHTFKNVLLDSVVPLAPREVTA